MKDFMGKVTFNDTEIKKVMTDEPIKEGTPVWIRPDGKVSAVRRSSGDVHVGIAISPTEMIVTGKENNQARALERMRKEITESMGIPREDLYQTGDEFKREMERLSKL
jgi:hypothetical protein